MTQYDLKALVGDHLGVNEYQGLTFLVVGYGRFNCINVLIMFSNRIDFTTRSSVVTRRSNTRHRHVSGFQQQHRLQEISFLLGSSPNILLGSDCHDWCNHISLQRSGYLYNTQTREVVSKSWKLASFIAGVFGPHSWNNHDSIVIYLLFFYCSVQLGCEQESLRLVPLHFCS